MEKKRMDYAPLWVRYRPMLKDRLSNAQLGKLTMAILDYQAEGIEPEDLDSVVSVFWMFIREDLIRAQLKYDQAVENGKKGGRPRKNAPKPEETPDNPEKPISTTTSTTTSTSETESTTPPASAQGEDLCVCQTAYGEFGWVRLTAKQYRQLQAIMGVPELERCIAYIDRAAQTTNNRNQWQDWALVLRRCYENRWHDAACKPDPIPKGASGVLGAAELEAIARVLNE